MKGFKHVNHPFGSMGWTKYRKIKDLDETVGSPPQATTPFLGWHEKNQALASNRGAFFFACSPWPRRKFCAFAGLAPELRIQSSALSRSCSGSLRWHTSVLGSLRTDMATAWSLAGES